MNNTKQKESNINHVYRWEDAVSASCAIRLLFASVPVELDGGFARSATWIKKKMSMIKSGSKTIEVVLIYVAYRMQRHMAYGRNSGSRNALHGELCIGA